MQVSNTLKHILPSRRHGCLHSDKFCSASVSLADEELAEKKKVRVRSTWQCAAAALVGLIVLCHELSALSGILPVSEYHPVSVGQTAVCI